MPRVSAEYLEERRAEILAAASRCFARDGFHQATMQDVVKESGLSPGAIYRYFDGKEALVIALAEERHARERSLLDGQRSASEPLASALDRLVDGFFLPLMRNGEREERRLGVQLWAEALRDPGVRKVVRKGVDEPRKRLVEILAAAKRRGEIARSVDEEAVARAFIALFQGFVLQQSWDEQVDVPGYVALLRQMVEAIATTARPKTRPPPRGRRVAR
jgi:AcrR family transcriptional regulator